MGRSDLLARIERLERALADRALFPPRCGCKHPLLERCAVCRAFWDRADTLFDWDALLRRPADLPDPADES